MGKSNDPSTWASFGNACRAYDSGNFHGLGFALCQGDGLVAIDLDKCIGESQADLSPEAFEICDKFKDVAYIEYSPSGKGLRLFTFGKAARSGKGNGEHKWIEMYDHTSPRYVTVTGSLLFGRKRTIGDGQEALDWLYQKYFHKEEEQPKRQAPTRPSNLSDRDILEAAENSSNGADFRRLYNGDAGSDHSSADLAFCNMLAFWCQRDPHQMDRIFRGSGLMRPKWDRNAGGGKTYGEKTIDKAISDCAEVYTPGRGNQNLSAAPASRKDKPSPEEEAKSKDWYQTLLRTRPNIKGETFIKSDPVNAVKILTHDRRWKGVLGYDEFRSLAVWLKKPEFSVEYDIEFERGKPLEELDVDRITYWLSERWGVSLNPDRCARIIDTVAQQNRFHPVREYLEGLEWDGVNRIDDWLFRYAHAKSVSEEQSEYIKLVGKWWLLSAVGRILVPGSKADYVLVLEGEEGIHKSSALRALAGDYFTDAALDLSNKDAYLQIQGAWIVEIAELDALMRAESSTAKSFFTRSTDKFRPPYGRKTIELARQCVCAGTVNHNDYIKDYTGGRRYWPVWCSKKIALEDLERDRDQIWAEAVHCYRRGDKYWPEGKRQRDLCRAEQEARQLDDPWEHDIVYWIAGRQSVTSAAILEHAIAMPKDRWNRSHQTRIGQIMTRLGWKRKRGREDGRMVTKYISPEEDAS
jgi:predicted P-loop ATPase